MCKIVCSVFLRVIKDQAEATFIICVSNILGDACRSPKAPRPLAREVVLIASRAKGNGEAVRTSKYVFDFRYEAEWCYRITN